MSGALKKHKPDLSANEGLDHGLLHYHSVVMPTQDTCHWTHPEPVLTPPQH